MEVFVDVCGPCYLKRSSGCLWSGKQPETILMSEDYDELVPFFSGPERAGPAHHWLLQWENWPRRHEHGRVRENWHQLLMGGAGGVPVEP